MKIIADTATLYSPQDGEKLGMTVVPVSVAVDGKSYKDYQEITSDEFIKLVEQGAVPTSSQPSVGEIIEVLEKSDEETVFITVGDGLSGAYQTAVGAKNCIENSENIHIINSKTLAGPLRYMAKKMVSLKEKGLSVEKIKEEIGRSIESSASFVIPDNFEFLKRSGRLTPMTAKIGTTLKLLPVLTQTDDKTRIKPIAIKRSWRSAVDTIVQKLQLMGVDERYMLSVCYADTYDRAVMVVNQLKEKFKKTETEILQLSPALITHGGPGCIVVQAVLK